MLAHGRPWSTMVDHAPPGVCVSAWSQPPLGTSLRFLFKLATRLMRPDGKGSLERNSWKTSWCIFLKPRILYRYMFKEESEHVSSLGAAPGPRVCLGHGRGPGPLALGPRPRAPAPWAPGPRAEGPWHPGPVRPRLHGSRPGAPGPWPLGVGPVAPGLPRASGACQVMHSSRWRDKRSYSLSRASLLLKELTP